MSDSKPGEPPHKFCEKITIATSRDVFLMGMHSGGEVSAFVLTPDHAKQLSRLLHQKVAEYEGAHGVLEGRLPSDPTPSPLQIKKSDAEEK
ncbi:MAG: hypothetical protein AAB923_02485 [Patescibacteria group bacterium]